MTSGNDFSEKASRSAKDNRIFILSLILGYIVVLTSIFVWLKYTSVFEIKEQLMTFTFYFSETNFVLILISFIFSWKHIIAGLEKIKRSSYVMIIFIMLLQFVLVFSVAPRTNRIFYDEDIYQEQGMNLALLHRAQLCDEANIEFGRLCCPIVKYNKWPNAYPYILSIIYRMFGVREIWAFIINNFLTSVHVLMIFFIYFNLFDNQKAALFSGLCFALIPMNSMWGNTAAVEPGAAFFNTLTVCAWTFSLKTNRKFILLLSILLTAFSIQFRLESVLLIPVIGVLVLLKKPGVYLQTSFWLFVLIAVILVIPVFGHYYAVQDEPWGARNQARFGIQYIETNLHSNIFYFFDIDRFPVLVTIIAILGSLWISFSKERSFLILWFFAFWGIFIFFYAGSYEYGADIRYSLVAYAPLILLAGYGIQALDNSMFVKNRRFSMTTVVCILLVVHFSWLIPLIRSEGEEAWEARLDHQYVEEIAEYLPDNSLVFTHNPNMFFIKGINAAQIYLALNADKQRMEEYFSRYKGGVYIHWNFWCNTLAPEEVKLCERVLAKYKVEKIMEKEFWRVHYILYEIVDCAKETEYQ